MSRDTGGASPGGRLGGYTAAGALATGAHYATLTGLVEGLAVAPGVAAGMGAALGALVAYALNRRLAFAATAAPHRQALPRFLAVAAGGAVLHGVLVWLGTSRLGLHYLLVQAAATGGILLIGYELNRRWSFAPPPAR